MWRSAPGKNKVFQIALSCRSRDQVKTLSSPSPGKILEQSERFTNGPQWASHAEACHGSAHLDLPIANWAISPICFVGLTVGEDPYSDKQPNGLISA